MPQSGADVTVTYNHTTPAQLRQLVKASTYCTQRLSYTCEGAAGGLALADGRHGWLSESGQLMSYWGGNTGAHSPHSSSVHVFTRDN